MTARDFAGVWLVVAFAVATLVFFSGCAGRQRELDRTRETQRQQCERTPDSYACLCRTGCP